MSRLLTLSPASVLAFGPVTGADLVVVSLLALFSFGLPGLALLAWLKLRDGSDD